MCIYPSLFFLRVVADTPEDESYTGASSVAEITDNDDDVFLPNSKTSDKPSQSKTKFFKEPLRYHFNCIIKLSINKYNF